MKVKAFSSTLEEYEERGNEWFTKHNNLDIRHLSVHLNQSSMRTITLVFYQEKEPPGIPLPLQEQG